MNKPFSKVLAYVLLTAFMTVSALTSAHGTWDQGVFTNASLKGTYYIPCASEGQFHVAGMGKVQFNGRDMVTLTQYQVYTEIEGNIVRPVIDGVIQPPYPNADSPAVRTGTYAVSREGFGEILWDDPQPGKATLMITEADRGRATSVYLIIDDAFPGVIIHVEASKR